MSRRRSEVPALVIVSRLVVPTLAAAALASTAVAQNPNPGTLEFGAVGQYVHFASPWALKDAYDLGGRFGVFLTPRWEVEAEFGASTPSGRAPRVDSTTALYQTLAGRVTYNVPVLGSQLLLELGLGTASVDHFGALSISPAIGYRWRFSGMWALRLDGVAEISRVPQAQRFSGTSSSTNFEFRMGVSFLAPALTPTAPPTAPPVVLPTPASSQTGASSPPNPRAAAPPPVMNPDSISEAQLRDSLAAAQAAARVQARADSASNAILALRDSLNAARQARAAADAKAREVVETEVYFNAGRFDLLEDATATLDAKLPILRANPDMRIRIEGNADPEGSERSTGDLPLRRAEAARAYLVQHGIDASRIDVVSNGTTKPVCTQRTFMCSVRNRRDDFVIIVPGGGGPTE